MVNKFLVSVVFFIVTQSSVLLSSAIFTGFPQDGAVLDQLVSEDLASRAKSVDGFASFFESLENRTSSYQDLSPYSEALTVWAESVDVIYYSALIVAQGDCNELDAALNETRAQFKEVIETLVSAIPLAHGGNYDENRSEIEIKRNLTEAGLVSTYGTLFDFLRCCITDSSEEFENLIREVQEKVNEDSVIINNALYESIEAYSILTSECTEDEAAAALASIEDIRYLVIITDMDNIKYIFSLYEASYIDNYLNGTGIVHGVFDIRLALKKMDQRLEKSMREVSSVIEGRLVEHNNHHEVQSYNATLTDPTSIIQLLLDANEYFLETVLVTLQNSSENVQVAGIIFPRLLEILIRHYYDAMDLAEAGLPCHITLLAIESIKKLQRLVIDYIVGKSFEIIGSDADTEARLAELRNDVVVSLREADDAVFKEIEVLSEVAHAADDASEDDFNDISTYRSASTAAIRDATTAQLYALLYKYIVESGY